MADMQTRLDPANYDLSMLEQFTQSGVTVENFLELFAQATPDPVTGEVGPQEIMRFMMRNSDHPWVQKIGNIAQATLKQRTEAFDADLTDFDFNSLASTIPTEPSEGWWLITMERYAYVNPAGEYIKDEDAPNVPGAKPMFILGCEQNGILRLIDQQIVGLPDSKTVLRFIKRCIATPIIGLNPALPRVMQITIKLSPHRDALQPFLDSLPAPFEWLIETPGVAQGMRDALDVHTQDKYAQFMAVAEAAKQEGNRAFNSKDRPTAIQKYTEAIDRAWDAASVRMAPEDRKAAHKLSAVCHANRAATYLLPGEDADPKKALVDSEKAENFDPDYVKGYYRQAKAHEALGDVPKAQETLRRALSRPALSSDKILLTLLNELDVQFD